MSPLLRLRNGVRTRPMNFRRTKWCKPFSLLSVFFVSLWFICPAKESTTTTQRHDDTKSTEDSEKHFLKSGQWFWDNHA